MKKVITMVVVAMVAGISSADLSVFWKSPAVGVQDTTGGTFVEGGVIQLVWSSAGIATAGGGQFTVDSGAIRGELDGLGAYILASSVTEAFGLWDAGTTVFSSADVGGADINTGFFFSRIYQNTGAAGESFLDIGQVDASAWVYDAITPSTTYGGSAVPGAPGTLAYTDQNGSTVIPEPATLGLMGIAGLGMFLARKKARR